MAVLYAIPVRLFHTRRLSKHVSAFLLATHFPSYCSDETIFNRCVGYGTIVKL